VDPDQWAVNKVLSLCSSRYHDRGRLTLSARSWRAGGSNRRFQSPRFVPQVAQFWPVTVQNQGSEKRLFDSVQVTITAEAGSVSLHSLGLWHEWDQIVFSNLLDLYHSWLDFGP